MITNNLDSQKQHCFFAFDNIVGDSEWARRTRRRVIQLSRHRFHTLIDGPRGTGKRLLARALHAHGPRREAPFIPVDCSRLPGFLFRTQMLGCAYPETTTLGCLRSADGGTLLLENVEELDLESQRLLLTVLETSQVQPLQCDASFKIDVRIISATSACLEDAVRQGRFLPELYSRLCVLPLETTELVRRREDIVPIARHLLARVTFECGVPSKRFDETALRSMTDFSWPGNVDEMLERLEVAVQHSDSDVVCGEDLGLSIPSVPSWPTLAELQTQHIRSTLSHVDGDLSRAAELLGIAEAELRDQLD